MQKAKMRTPNGTQENIAYIAARFPHLVTEARGADGEPTYKLDYDLLRQELSSELIEEGEERYCLNWPGKKQALLAANGWLDKTLRPVDASFRAEQSRAEQSRAEQSSRLRLTHSHLAQRKKALSRIIWPGSAAA